MGWANHIIAGLALQCSRVGIMPITVVVDKRGIGTYWRWRRSISEPLISAITATRRGMVLAHPLRVSARGCIGHVAFIVADISSPLETDAACTNGRNRAAHGVVVVQMTRK